ncbi:uncharacterized protein KZ484_013024 [Pholidichthys leucotaenia]
MKSTSATLSNDVKKSCNAAEVENASQQISAAVDILAGQLSCKRDTNASFTEERSSALEGNLRQIVELTLGVFLELRNIFFIKNPTVREIILSQTLTALLPVLGDFEAEDYRRWLEFLSPVLASLDLGYLNFIPRNITCASYRAIHDVLTQALEPLHPTNSPVLQLSIRVLEKTFKRCVITQPLTCKTTPVMEDNICDIINGSPLEQSLLSDNSSAALCNFTITEHACSSATHLTAENVVTLLNCSLDSQETYSVQEWKLFFQKASPSLNQALEDYADKAPQSNNPALSIVLEALAEVTIAKFSQEQLQNQSLVSDWFNTKLRPFLALPSCNFLFCLSSNNFSCLTYQTVIQAFDSQRASMDRDTQKAVFTSFIKPFLSRNDSSDPGCVSSVAGSAQWVKRNFGSFSKFATLKDFQVLNPNFSSVEVAALLTPNQLAELAATPFLLKESEDVIEIIKLVSNEDLDDFFDIVSPAIEANQASFTQEVKTAFLQLILDRANLSSPELSDKDFQVWLVRLSPLLVNISSGLVVPLFEIVTNRSCNSIQAMITLLDTLQMTLSSNTKAEIFNNIFRFLKGPPALRCYDGGSFYVFLRKTLLRFGFLDLSMFLSLLPPTRVSELLNTFNTSEMSQFVSQPNVLGNDTDLCVIFNNYSKTATFLETEDVPVDVKKEILPCVWPLALSANSRSEANLWFDVRLKNYLQFLNKALINFSEVREASCFGFQKLVYVMGNNFTYSSSDFGPEDVYSTIRKYLQAASGPRCYNASNPELNSTAWFVNNIGNFVTFITLEDLTTFVPNAQFGEFALDHENLELFNKEEISEDVINYYVTLVFEDDMTINPAILPGFLQCSTEIPVLSYTSLTEADSLSIFSKLNEFCNGTNDPEVSAALSSNIQTITSSTIQTLGSASSSLTRNQLSSTPGNILVEALTTLSTVVGFSMDQASIIVQNIQISGFKINSAASLESLGTLVAGIPQETLTTISSSELISVANNSAFVANIKNASVVLQHTYVSQIITADTSPPRVVETVPDGLAAHIPPSLLVFSEGSADFSVLNKKDWTPDQATMFFGSLENSVFAIEQLSPSVLAGFTCTSVRKIRITKVQQLVTACRPRPNRAEVLLKESQLTCMYNLVRGHLSQNFTEYPSDMLLYFTSENVKKTNCRAFLIALGAADFTVPSKVLQKNELLLGEARSCLGINGFNLSRDNVEVLGNMVCTLNETYIQNAESFILEKLKVCSDLSDSQVAAIEGRLQSGETKYGNISTWTQQTLKNLGIFPLYFSRNIWGFINFETKEVFLKEYLLILRQNKTDIRKLKRLFRMITIRRARRGAGCTVGNITQVTISSPAFPFGYDENQFYFCLDLPVLTNNLPSICEKVVDSNFQEIILRKLNEAFPSGLSEQNVRVLASVSRSATIEDIAKWTITKVGTLETLMATSDGSWEPAQSKLIITKYLNTSGNSLGTIELNLIGSNLCSLDTSTLKTITQESIRNANAPNLSSCSTEQKKVLYKISKAAFGSQNYSSDIFYQLIKAYLGGAPLNDIVALSTQNISMEVETFTSLDPDVIRNLTVSNVQGLMGTHLPDVKLFENETTVQEWVNLQLLSDLETLGIGLVSNMTGTTTKAPDTTTPGSSVTSTAAPGSSVTSTAAPGSSVTSTAAPGSSVTSTAAPGSNVTSTAAPGSNVTSTAAPGSSPAASSTTMQGASGGTAVLGKTQSSIFLGALLTTLLQLLLQPALIPV